MSLSVTFKHTSWFLLDGAGHEAVQMSVQSCPLPGKTLSFLNVWAQVISHLSNLSEHFSSLQGPTSPPPGDSDTRWQQWPSDPSSVSSSERRCRRGFFCITDISRTASLCALLCWGSLSILPIWAVKI